MANKVSPPNRLDVFVSRLNRWSRPLRIAIATFTAAILTLIIGYITLQVFYGNSASAETDYTPFLIGVSLLGCGAYAFGWSRLVGFDLDEDRPWQASRASAYWIIAGLFGLLIVGLAILGGLAFGYLL